MAEPRNMMEMETNYVIGWGEWVANICRGYLSTIT